jgi:hypothetical protein
MTLIPIGINQASPAKNIARAIVAFQSIAAPSVSTPVVLGAPTGTPPVRPTLLAATVAGAGIAKYFAGFLLFDNYDGKAEMRAQIPYSVKLFAREMDERQSILSLGLLSPIIKAVTSPSPITGDPANLEQYLYDQYVALKLVLPSVSISRYIDPNTGRSYISMDATMTDASTADLLTDTMTLAP